MGTVRAFEMRKEFIAKGRSAAATRQGGCCKYCFEPFAVSPATAEHRVPRSKGGSNLAHNIDAACARCNKLKAAMTVGEFLKRIKHPDGGSVELLLAASRRRIWLRTHRARRRIGQFVGIELDLPIGPSRRAA